MRDVAVGVLIGAGLMYVAWHTEQAGWTGWTMVFLTLTLVLAVAVIAEWQRGHA